jgi:hypothetical protein
MLHFISCVEKMQEIHSEAGEPQLRNTTCSFKCVCKLNVYRLGILCSLNELGVAI